MVFRDHSRPQRPRSFLKITPSGQVQRHSSFEWLCKHNRLRPEPIRFVRLDSEHAQSNGKFLNRGLPELDLARGRDFQCWPKGSRPLGTRECLEIKSIWMRIECLCGTNPRWFYLWTAFLSQSTHAPWNRKSQNLGLLKWIIPELRVLALTKRHVGSGNEIELAPANC